VPYQTFRAADGWIIVAVGNDEQFRRFVTTGEAPELVNNPTWARNADRVRGRETLVPMLEKMVERRPAAWWIEALEAVGVPCGPIQNLAQVFEHPQVQARGLELGLDRAGATVRTVANPVRFSETPLRMELAPPALGADTEGVLTELCGLSADRLAALRNDGVI